MGTKLNTQKNKEDPLEVVRRVLCGKSTLEDYRNAVECLSKNNTSYLFRASGEYLKIASKQIFRDSESEVKILVSGPDDFIFTEDCKDEISIFLEKKSSKLKIFCLNDIKNCLPGYIKKFIEEKKVEFLYTPSIILFWKNFNAGKNESAFYPIICNNRVQVRFTDDEGKDSSFVSFRGKLLYSRMLERFDNLLLGLENAI